MDNHLDIDVILAFAILYSNRDAKTLIWGIVNFNAKECECIKLHKNMEKEKLIFDLEDIKLWRDQFNEMFKDLDKTQNKYDLLHEFTEKVISQILNSNRVSYTPWIHQAIAVDTMLESEDNIIISHASRSDKSITFLDFKSSIEKQEDEELYDKIKKKND